MKGGEGESRESYVSDVEILRQLRPRRSQPSIWAQRRQRIMERRTVGVARLRAVPEKADRRPGGRDQRRGTPDSADATPLEAGDDTSRQRAGPWGEASAQVLSGYRRFDATRKCERARVCC